MKYTFLLAKKNTFLTQLENMYKSLKETNSKQAGTVPIFFLSHIRHWRAAATADSDRRNQMFITLARVVSSSGESGEGGAPSQIKQ